MANEERSNGQNKGEIWQIEKFAKLVIRAKYGKNRDQNMANGKVCKKVKKKAIYQGLAT